MAFINLCCSPFQVGSNKKPMDAVIPQTEIGQLYDRISHVYDWWGKLTESKARDRALQLADIQDGSTVVEVAVGTGLAFERIVRQNPHGINIGIDLSSGMLAKARKRLSKIDTGSYTLSQGSAYALELASDSVDVLVNNYMFDLIPFDQMDQVLAEFNRVLKPGGKLVMVNMTEPGGRGVGIYNLIYSMIPRAMGGCRGVVLSDRLSDMGFSVKVREVVRQLFFPSEVILAANQQPE